MKESFEVETTKKLRRQNGIIGGVCGGLAAFFGISPFWFRLVFVLLMLPGGLPGLLPYLLMWIIIPSK
jgi:phage shock protein C